MFVLVSKDAVPVAMQSSTVDSALQPEQPVPASLHQNQAPLAAHALLV